MATLQSQYSQKMRTLPRGSSKPTYEEWLRKYLDDIDKQLEDIQAKKELLKTAIKQTVIRRENEVLRTYALEHELEPMRIGDSLMVIEDTHADFRMHDLNWWGFGIGTLVQIEMLYNNDKVLIKRGNVTIGGISIETAYKMRAVYLKDEEGNG